MVEADQCDEVGSVGMQQFKVAGADLMFLR